MILEFTLKYIQKTVYTIYQPIQICQTVVAGCGWNVAYCRLRVGRSSATANQHALTVWRFVLSRAEICVLLKLWLLPYTQPHMEAYEPGINTQDRYRCTCCAQLTLHMNPTNQTGRPGRSIAKDTVTTGNCSLVRSSYFGSIVLAPCNFWIILYFMM